VPGRPYSTTTTVEVRKAVARILDALKAFHRSIEEGEHLKEENLHTREELAEIQLRRGKQCIYGVIGAAAIVSLIEWEITFPTNIVTVLASLAGVAGLTGGLYNRYIHQP
jgi:hypothetical protein